MYKHSITGYCFFLDDSEEIQRIQEERETNLMPMGRPTGEYRCPHKGEYFLSGDDYPKVFKARFEFTNIKAPIVEIVLVYYAQNVVEHSPEDKKL